VCEKDNINDVILKPKECHIEFSPRYPPELLKYLFVGFGLSGCNY
jgi:hypothetical protein